MQEATDQSDASYLLRRKLLLASVGSMLATLPATAQESDRLVQASFQLPKSAVLLIDLSFRGLDVFDCLFTGGHSVALYHPWGCGICSSGASAPRGATQVSL